MLLRHWLRFSLGALYLKDDVLVCVNIAMSKLLERKLLLKKIDPHRVP